MYHHLLERIIIQQKKIDAINKALIHIYIILLLIVSLIIFQNLT